MTEDQQKYLLSFLKLSEGRNTTNLVMVKEAIVEINNIPLSELETIQNEEFFRLWIDSDNLYGFTLLEFGESLDLTTFIDKPIARALLDLHRLDVTAHNSAAISELLTRPLVFTQTGQQYGFYNRLTQAAVISGDLGVIALASNIISALAIR